MKRCDAVILTTSVSLSTSLLPPTVTILFLHLSVLVLFPGCLFSLFIFSNNDNRRTALRPLNFYSWNELFYNSVRNILQTCDFRAGIIRFRYTRRFVDTLRLLHFHLTNSDITRVIWSHTHTFSILFAWQSTCDFGILRDLTTSIHISISMYFKENRIVASFYCSTDVQPWIRNSPETSLSAASELTVGLFPVTASLSPIAESVCPSTMSLPGTFGPVVLLFSNCGTTEFG